MNKKIVYKTPSPEYSNMVAPSEIGRARSGVGLDQSIGEYYFIEITDLIPFHNQARKIFNDADISALAESIKLYGIRQPLTIMKSQNDINTYEIISGERRLKAAIIAGLKKVPCIIIKKDQSPNEIALVENLHRSDLHPLELMAAFQSLLDNKVCATISEIAEKIGITRTTINEIINLQNLPESTRNLILDKQIKSRSLMRNLMKSPLNKHNELISIFENGKQKSKTRKKKTLESKIKILNIILHADDFVIENSRVDDLSILQKSEFKQILLNIVEKLS